MNDSIRYEKANGVATLTKVNAQYRQGMTREVLVGLKRGLEDARDDSSIRVVVISAAGDGFHEGARVVDQLRPDMTYTPIEFQEIVRRGDCCMGRLTDRATMIALEPWRQQCCTNLS